MDRVPKRVSVYVDESGRGRPDNRHNPEQPYFIVGAFVTTRADDLTAVVNQVCDEENFRRELHWRVFNRTAARVYARVAERIDQERDWTFKATQFQVDAIDFTFFGGATRDARPVEREHITYNFFVKEAIKAALRYSRLLVDATDLEIIVDEKARTRSDNFISYIRRTFAAAHPDLTVSVRDCPSETERLIQVCDIMSGAHNTLTVGTAGASRLEAARRVWVRRCQKYAYPLRRPGA